MNDSQRFLMIVVKILPMHGVRAIGLKFPGEDGSSAAELFPIGLTAATFHQEWTMDCSQQLLYGLCKVLDREGHLRNLVADLVKGGGSGV